MSGIINTLFGVTVFWKVVFDSKGGGECLDSGTVLCCDGTGGPPIWVGYFSYVPVH